MKGKSCSWTDMRKIQHIMANEDKLRGQYDALMRCGAKATRSNWRTQIELMETVPLREPRHFQPTHAREIVRHAPKEKWTKWVERCESEELTVIDLRNLLMAEKSNHVEIGETCTVNDLQTLITSGKKFGTIYADPPWPYGNQATRSSTAKVYKTSKTTMADILALPVNQLSAEDSHLHLWTTNAFLFDAKTVMEAWGFEYKSVFVWVKSSLGIGNYWRVSHEFMLLGVKGNAKFRDRSIKSWLECDREKHSQKPYRVRTFVERVSPAPRLELYGRQPCEGWVVWGDEIQKTLFTQDVAAV